MNDENSPPRNSILIVGGGASGVIAAVHLLREGGPDLRVRIVSSPSAR